MEAVAAGGDQAKRAFDAMLDMKKIDVAAIEARTRVMSIASGGKTAVSDFPLLAFRWTGVRSALAFRAEPHGSPGLSCFDP